MDEWHKIIVDIQNEISEEDGVSSDFQNRYRWDEIWYSYYVAEMMFKDALHNRDRVNNILDIGCGYGTLSKFAQKVYGAEVCSIDMVKKIPISYVDDLNFIKMDIEYDEIPYDVMFDRIIFTEVFEHLKHCPIPTLKKISGQLKKDGFLFLSTPDASSWGRVDTFYNHIGEMKNPDPNQRLRLDTHVYQYTEGEIRYILDRANLNIIDWKIVNPPAWGRHFNAKIQKEI
jgi:SAM-dependent methyltransferase